MVSLLRLVVLIQLITETVYSAVAVVSNYILVLAKYSRKDRTFWSIDYIFSDTIDNSSFLLLCTILLAVTPKSY